VITTPSQVCLSTTVCSDGFWYYDGLEGTPSLDLTVQNGS
jgi:hypothetical protein